VVRDCSDGLEEVLGRELDFDVDLQQIRKPLNGIDDDNNVRGNRIAMAVSACEYTIYDMMPMIGHDY
jgi:hypothetical protein